MDERSQTLYEKLLAHKKYADVCPDAVRRIILECQDRYKKPKELEKAVRERLHGITSAFSELDPQTELLAARLTTGDDEGLAAVLSRHASTRERLPLSHMDALYRRIFALTGPPESILDLACGLNPLYLLHRLPKSCQIAGIDLSRRCVSMFPGGICADLLNDNALPDQPFQIALLFKILPLLERQRSGAGAQLLRRIHARYLVVSFPTRTMGGRNVGMEPHYSQWMETHFPENRRIVARFSTDNELFYIMEETRHA